jgi:hypothetical protein
MTTNSLLAGIPKRKRGRPPKVPGEPVDHHLSAKMKAALDRLVEDGLSIAECATASDLTSSAIYKGLRQSGPAQQYYLDSLKSLRLGLRARALHTLRVEMETSKNSMARIQAARILLDELGPPPAQPNANLPQQAGFTFAIVHLPPPATAAPLIEHAPAAAQPGDIAMVSRRSGVFRSGPTDRD